MEGAYINIQLIIWNRESGTGNWFFVPYLSKRLGYFKILIGNRKSGTGSLFHILESNTKELVPGSLFSIIGFILLSVFFYFINM